MVLQRELKALGERNERDYGLERSVLRQCNLGDAVKLVACPTWCSIEETRAVEELRQKHSTKRSESLL